MITCLIGTVLGIGEILLIAVCATIVIGVVAAAIVRKVKGKTDCGGNCGCCGGCSHCRTNDATSKRKYRDR